VNASHRTFVMKLIAALTLLFHLVPAAKIFLQETSRQTDERALTANGVGTVIRD
jgi:hypothetical protein